MNIFSPTEIKAVVFDLDLTLIDSDEVSKNSVRGFLESSGIEITREEVQKLLSEGALPGALRHCFKPENIPKAINDFTDFARKYVLFTSPFPGVRSAINELLSAEKKLAILSARPEKSIRDYTFDFPENSFSAVVGCDSLKDGVCKPNPDALKSTLELIGVSPDNTIFVGDSGSDMKTSYLAGVRGVLVRTGGLSDKAIEMIKDQFKPIAIVKDVPELVRGIRTDTLFTGNIPSAYDIGWSGD